MTAADVGRADRSFEALTAEGDVLHWVEERPEQGRAALVRWRDGHAEVLASDYVPRSRVNEYGGGAYAVHNGRLFFCNGEDQRLYRWDSGRQPSPLTPEPERPAGLRYADLCPTPDGGSLLCVRERHDHDGIHQELVAVPADGMGDVTVLFAGSDFCSSPRLSPDGRLLAWTTWNLPAMPWDATTLWLAEMDPHGLVAPRPIAGGTEESVLQPAWSPEGMLHLVSDRSGWWNLYRWRDGTLESLAPMAAEFAEPPWEFGYATYAFLPGDRIACLYRLDGVPRLGVLRPGGALKEVDLPFRSFKPFIAAVGESVAVIAATPHTAPGVALVDVDDADTRMLTPPDELPDDLVSEPRPVTARASDGAVVHAWFHPPRNPTAIGPAGERPPLVVRCHSGPTSQSRLRLDMAVQFLTTRGLAVVDVDFAGSSGYGRAFRERLDGRWGVADVEDCRLLARALADSGMVDGARTVMWGTSAGGLTALGALAADAQLAGAVSVFGIADLEQFALGTHRFQSGHVERLLGPLPEAVGDFRARSPRHLVDRIAAPVLLVHGDRDPIVPLAPVREIAEELEHRGTPAVLLILPDTGHGFARSEDAARTAEAELAFYGRVLGFTPG